MYKYPALCCFCGSRSFTFPIHADVPFRYTLTGWNDFEISVRFNIIGSQASLSLILHLCFRFQHFEVLLVLAGVLFRDTLIGLSDIEYCVCNISGSLASISLILDLCLKFQHFGMYCVHHLVCYDHPWAPRSLVMVAYTEDARRKLPSIHGAGSGWLMTF